MFEGFETHDIQTEPVDVHNGGQHGGARIRTRIGGEGPPLLLLHGYPQTHAMWHKIAPRFAENYTVICPDLRGYGDSEKPETTEDHSPYSKREMAADQIGVMRHFGFKSFKLVGHDRGGRVSHRMAIDHPDAVERVTVLDIAPTHKMFTATNMEFARRYWHWFFLIQPHDTPERMIGADPVWYLNRIFKGLNVPDGTFSTDAVAEYIRCFNDPLTIHTTCEDYRASVSIDLVQDEEDWERKLKMPLQALWGSKGVVGKVFDVLGAWRERADNVTGHAVECGHYLPEEAPDETFEAVSAFLEKS